MSLPFGRNMIARFRFSTQTLSFLFLPQTPLCVIASVTIVERSNLRYYSIYIKKYQDRHVALLRYAPRDDKVVSDKKVDIFNELSTKLKPIYFKHHT